MKKTFMSLVCMLFALTMNAQSFTKPATPDTPFAEGKVFLGSSLSGLNLGYTDNEKWKMNFSVKAGYMLIDNWLVSVQAGYDYLQEGNNAFTVGGGLRYYIEDNGLFLGAGGNYVHHWHTYDDFLPTVQLGYSFFLNRTVTIEPEIYYNQSIQDQKYSGLGFRIGVGIYFE